MCPFCWSTLALAAAGASSVGGLAVLAAAVSRKKSGTKDSSTNSEQKEK